MRVAAAPERGLANLAVLDLLSETLGIPRERLELLTGHGARDKVVAVSGLTGAEAERRLSGAVAARR